MPDLSSHSALELTFALWLLAIGGAIGSFLNVVVYRLPAGLSLVAPSSHCPKCKRPIRWRDNIPVLGWLLLRGRCRDCGESIAARYPLVEAITAAMFLLVGLVEGFSCGANLSVRPRPAETDIVLLSLSFNQALGIAGYHLLLLSTLFAAALIEYDGHRAPWRVYLPVIAAGVLLPLAWPHLRPVPAWLIEPDWLAGLVDGMAGLVLGLGIGGLAWLIFGAKANVDGTRRVPDGLGTRRVPSTLLTGPACAGLFLGWQATLVLGVLTVAVHAATWVVARRWPVLLRFSPGVWLWLFSAAWILGWAYWIQWLPELAYAL